MAKSWTQSNGTFSSNGGNGIPIHAAATSTQPPPPPPPYVPDPSIVSPSRSPFTGVKCMLTLIALLAVVTAGVLVPLYITGVLSIGSKHKNNDKNGSNTYRRSTYDPFYYGNLHPYLYPKERAEMGIAADYDVIVIGAGMAGLAAATSMQKEGLTVLVLEAREQVGGRVLSAPFGRGSVELGAQWLVGAESNPVTALATRYGVPRAKFLSAMQRGYAGDDVAEAQATAANATATPLIEQILNTTGSIDSNDSVDQVINSFSGGGGEEATSSRLSLTSPFLSQTVAGAPLDNLAAIYYNQTNNTLTGAAALSLGSLRLIPFNLAADINSTAPSTVKLNAPVTSISLDTFNATVQTRNGAKYSAQYVICTVPLGVLQEGAVQFRPALPNVTLEAIYRLGVGTVNPVHLIFNTPFWDATSETLSLSTSAQGGWVDFLSLLTFTGEAMLVALPGSVASAAIEQQTDAQVLQDVMAALRKKYGNAVPSSPVTYMVTRWGLNPFARGTHSYYAVGSAPADRSTLAEPVGGTLLFAGEAANSVFPASLHGAYLSGQAQADRIIAAMEFPDEGSAGVCMAQCYGATDVNL